MSKRVRQKDKRQRVSLISSAFLEHKTFLEKFLKRFFSNQQDIEDVAQEAYLRAYVAEQSKEIDQPKSYLFRTAKNLALTKLTGKSAQITDYLEELGVSMVIDSAISNDTVTQEIEAKESLGAYCDAIAALPKKCRQVYLLRKVHGLTHKEIAKHMSLSVSSVEKYLRRGLTECREHLQSCEDRLRPPITTVRPERNGTKGFENER